jgi:general secretion pathway protein F
VSVSEVEKTGSKKEPTRFSISSFFTRVRPAEVAMMTRQLSTLVGAGLPLVSAIDILIPQTKSSTFKRILAQIKTSIVEGNSFAGSLSSYPGVYSSLYVNMVHAGETSGTLEIVLERLADITEKQEDFKNRVRTALAYPVFMSVIGALVLFLLLTYIVPSITVIFEDMSQTLPTPTLLLIRFSDFLKQYWWVFISAVILVGIAFRSLKKTERGKRFIDKTLLRLTIIGTLSKKLAAARFARTLGSLLENGVSMLQALGIVRNIVGNVHIANAVDEAAKNVGKGQGLGDSLGVSDVFPSLCIQMIQVGEQSGELERLLDKVATVFENEVESSIMRMTSRLEPMMILVMGVIVGFIVLSICLPIFEMNQLVR